MALTVAERVPARVVPASLTLGLFTQLKKPLVSVLVRYA